MKQFTRETPEKQNRFLHTRCYNRTVSASSEVTWTSRSVVAWDSRLGSSLFEKEMAWLDCLCRVPPFSRHGVLNPFRTSASVFFSAHRTRMAIGIETREVKVCLQIPCIRQKFFRTYPVPWVSKSSTCRLLPKFYEDSLQLLSSATRLHVSNFIRFFATLPGNGTKRNKENLFARKVVSDNFGFLFVQA